MARLEQEEEEKETPRMWEVGVREHGQVAEVGDNSECLRVSEVPMQVQDEG